MSLTIPAVIAGLLASSHSSCTPFHASSFLLFSLGGYLPFEEPDPDLVEEGIEEDRELEEIIIEGKVEVRHQLNLVSFHFSVSG